MADEYQNPEIEQSEEYAQMSPSVYESDFLKERIKVKDLINNIRHKLMGEIYDDDEHKWVKVGEPLMNNKGINITISLLSCYIDPNTVFSELSTNDINYFMQRWSIGYITAMVGQDWDIVEEEAVKNALEFVIYATLKRALNRGEAESIGRLTQVSKTVINKEDKGGTIGKLWKRGR